VSGSGERDGGHADRHGRYDRGEGAGAGAEALERARVLIGDATRLLVFTGAGVSAESGIPTFRDALEGHWARHDPTRLATEEGFRADPALVWRWYAERRAGIARAEPNAAHRAIADAQRPGRRLAVVTQNVDGLHRRAGSRDVIELHGSIVRARCLEGCGPASEGWERDARVPPPCPRCGVAPLRPGVVWFGERLPPGAFERAERLAAEADALLVVGTSGLVQPAASLPLVAARRHRPVIVVDPNPTGLDGIATVSLRGRAADVVPALLRDGAAVP
jgi:NAD-dependent deacetylase